MGLAKKAVADTSITFLWVFCMASLGAVATSVAPSLGIQGSGKVYLVFGMVTILIIAFSALAQALGGASWNPTALVAFAYAGASDDTPFSLGIRLPAQMIGAVGGALSILEVVPKKYKHMLGGPKLKVPLETGVLAEAVLTFAITLIVLWAVLKGPRNGLAKSFIIIPATIALVIAGSAYTGPAMNPANAFGWAFVDDQHTSWEHFAVYWVGPMIGTIASVWAFNLLFGPKQPAKLKAVKGEISKKLESLTNDDSGKEKSS